MTSDMSTHVVSSTEISAVVDSADDDDSDSEDVPEFILSERGSNLLVLNEHVYRSSFAGNKNRSDWACALHSKLRPCRARVTLRDNVVWSWHGKHTHPPDPKVLMKKRFVSTAQVVNKEQPAMSLKSIYKDLVEKYKGTAAPEDIPSWDYIRSALYRIRYRAGDKTAEADCEKEVDEPSASKKSPEKSSTRSERTALPERMTISAEKSNDRTSSNASDSEPSRGNGGDSRSQSPEIVVIKQEPEVDAPCHSTGPTPAKKPRMGSVLPTCSNQPMYSSESIHNLQTFMDTWTNRPMEPSNMPMEPQKKNTSINSISTNVPMNSNSTNISTNPTSTKVLVNPNSANVTINPNSANMPMNPNSANMPMNSNSAKMPMNSNSTNMPMNPNSTNMPMNPNSANVPMNPNSANVPMSPNSANVPMNPKSSNVPMPMNLNSANMPMNPNANMPMGMPSGPILIGPMPGFSPEQPVRDQFQIYGEYVAGKLRQMDSLSCAHIQKAISNLIFDAEMGKYKT